MKSSQGRALDVKLALQNLRPAANEMKIIPWPPGSHAGEESCSVSPGLWADALRLQPLAGIRGQRWARGQWGLLLCTQGSEAVPTPRGPLGPQSALAWGKTPVISTETRGLPSGRPSALGMCAQSLLRRAGTWVPAGAASRAQRSPTRSSALQQFKNKTNQSRERREQRSGS